MQRGDCACKVELTAFLRCCDLMDLVMAIPLGIISPQALREAVDAFLGACKDAGWERYFIKKFHWILHLAQHLEKWGMIPTCFSLERKHRVVKCFAKSVLNTQDYARSLYRETINHELSRLRLDPDIFKRGVFLTEKHRPSAKTLKFVCEYFESNISKDDCYVSNSAHLEPDGYAVKGDVVLLKAAENDHGPWAASQVWLHVEIAGMAPISLVCSYDFVRYDEHTYTATCAIKAAPVFVYTGDILASTVCRKSPGQVVTLIPLAHR